jgi:hypothetical protein
MNFVQYQSCHGITNKARTNASQNRKARVHCWRSGGSLELLSPGASLRRGSGVVRGRDTGWLFWSRHGNWYRCRTQ